MNAQQARRRRNGGPGSVPRLKIKNPQQSAKKAAGVLKGIGTALTFVPGVGPLVGNALKVAGNQVDKTADRLPSSVPQLAGGDEGRPANRTAKQKSATSTTLARPGQATDVGTVVEQSGAPSPSGLIPGAPTTGNKAIDGGVLAALVFGAAKLAGKI